MDSCNPIIPSYCQVSPAKIEGGAVVLDAKIIERLLGDFPANH
jgi:hypothetical protein